MISALLYEWRRLWSVKSTWIVGGIYLFIVGFLGAGPIFLVKEENVQSWAGLYATPSTVLALVALSVVSAQAFGHEYRYGLIRLTLSEFPMREKVLIAKTLITSLYVTIMLFLAWCLLGVIGLVAGNKVSSTARGFSIGGERIPTLLEVFLWTIGYCLISFSVALLTRNLALGIVLPLLLDTLIEPLLGLINQITKDRIEWIVSNLPMTNASAWLQQDSNYSSPGLIFMAWVIAIYLLATARFAFKDA
jgi:ABC-type transport system involved in multi-copper enzyme maturation permease subunit